MPDVFYFLKENYRRTDVETVHDMIQAALEYPGSSKTRIMGMICSTWYPYKELLKKAVEEGLIEERPRKLKTHGKVVTYESRGKGRVTILIVTEKGEKWMRAIRKLLRDWEV